MAKESKAIEPRDEPTRIGGIDYPDEVIRALLERRLVVFAGAGVSMDPPTCLPSFEGLVSEVERLTRFERFDDESPDQYLGRCEADSDFNVREIVRQLLMRDETRHNTNHVNLLRMFESSGSVRLVTTNFDMMFEQARDQVGWTTEVFTAPLLPTKTDFNGIVHLHGSLADPRRMVLTDKDFGRAYLRHGLPSEFLMELVRCYTVLFVGYSNNDVMLRYLLSAVRDVSGGKLFMLIPSRYPQTALQSGIHPIQYGQDSTTDHSVLKASIARMGSLFSQRADEWRLSIERSVSRGLPIQQEDEEVIRLALRWTETTMFFVNAADRVTWVQWLDENGYLTPIFKPGESTRACELLAHFVARVCVRDSDAYVLRLLDRHDFTMSDHLWQQLVFAVCRTESREISLSQWVTIVLQQPVERMDGDALSSLARACGVRGDAEALLLLYDFLVMPRTVGHHHEWSGFDEYVKITEDTLRKSGGSLALHHCADMLDTQEESILKQALESGIRSLERRHRLLKVWEKATDCIDPWSTVYDPINRTDSREQPEGFDLLCVVTRQQIHSIVKSDGLFADELIGRLARSPAPILRRLAVDAVRIRDDLSAETKAVWLMKRTTVADTELASEMARLLEQAFPNLSDQNQSRVVGWLLDGEAQQGSDEDIVAGKQSRWLRTLRRSDPTSKSVKSELQRLRRRAPKSYARPHPERLVSVGEAGFIKHPKPFTVDELLGAPASAWVDDLLSWQPSGRWIWSEARRGLLDDVRQACIRDFGWGNGLAKELIHRNDASTDLWGAMLTAWQDGGCEVANWSEVLESLAFVSDSRDLARDIAFTLVRFAKEARGSGLFERANSLVAAMWRENSDDAEGWLSNGPLMASWNSAAGLIPMYWVEVAKRLLVDEIEMGKISTKLKSEVAEIVRSETQQSMVGKVSLGAWFHVLHRIDKEWSIRVLVPMFGHTHSGFEAAWEGFLWTFQGTLWMPNEMLVHVEAAIAHRQEINTQQGVSVSRFVSYLCCTQDSELAHRLFTLLFTTASDTRSSRHDVANFVIGVRLILRRMDVERRAKVWQLWLRAHLERRKNRVPRDLVIGEVWELLMLIPVMLPAAREIVDVLVDFPIDNSESNNFSSIFHQVDVDDFPEDYAKLMLYLDQYELHPWQWNYNKEHIDKLIANETVPSDQRKRLARLKRRYMID